MMRNTSFRVVLAASFALCLTCVLALSRYGFVKPALAHQQTQKIDSPKWEYCALSQTFPGQGEWKATVDYFHQSGTQQVGISSDVYGGGGFAKLGSDGWELVGQSEINGNRVWIFKRRMQ